MTGTTSGTGSTTTGAGQSVTPDGVVRTTAQSRPPRTWRILTLAVFGVIAVHLVTTVLALIVQVQERGLVDRLRADRTSVRVAEILALADRESTVGAIASIVFLAYLGGFVAWFRVTRRTVADYDGPRTATSHWSLTIWRISVGAVAVLSVVLHKGVTVQAGDLAGALRVASENELVVITILALRFPLAALLVLGICVVVRRVYRLAASQPVAKPYESRQSRPGVQPLPRTAIQAGPGGDEFWFGVAAAVARSAGPLPLLEAWAPAARARRWHLLTDDAAVDAARSGIQPWAGVTLYSEPPRTPDETVLRQLADEARRLRVDESAGGAVGLIGEGGGRPTFAYLTSDEDVAAWLDRGRAAALVGVYPALAAGDPAALSVG